MHHSRHYGTPGPRTDGWYPSFIPAMEWANCSKPSQHTGLPNLFLGKAPPPLPLLLSSMHYSVYGMHKVNVTSRRRYLRSTFAVPFSVAKFSEPFALGRASMD